MQANTGPVFIDPPNIVTRNLWGAVESDLELVLPVPVSHLLMTYTGGLECLKPRECAMALKKLQRRDMQERGMPDIQHNFYVGSDGIVYEGRGFYFKATKEPRHMDLDDKSVDIAFIGDFTYKHPSSKMLRAAGELAQYMVRYFFLQSEFTLVPLGSSHWRIPDDRPKDKVTNEDGAVYYKVGVSDDSIIESLKNK